MKFAIGNIVHPNFPHQLRSGAEYYFTAIVVSVDPFVIVSPRCDMLWSHMQPSQFSVYTEAASKKDMRKAMARYYRDYPDRRPLSWYEKLMMSPHFLSAMTVLIVVVLAFAFFGCTPPKDYPKVERLQTTERINVVGATGYVSEFTLKDGTRCIVYEASSHNSMQCQFREPR